MLHHSTPLNSKGRQQAQRRSTTSSRMHSISKFYPMQMAIRPGSQPGIQLTALSSVLTLSLSLSLRPRFSRTGRDQGVRSRHHTSLALVKVMKEGRESRGLSPRSNVCIQASGDLEGPHLGVAFLRVPRKSQPGTDTFMSSAIIPQPGLSLSLSKSLSL